VKENKEILSNQKEMKNGYRFTCVNCQKEVVIAKEDCKNLIEKTPDIGTIKHSCGTEYFAFLNGDDYDFIIKCKETEKYVTSRTVYKEVV